MREVGCKLLERNTKEVIQVVVSAIDITEKRKIEKQLFTKKKMEAIGNTAAY
jgi:dTDP-4-dehydrorhamnose reductase